jgi:hypothetical protein
VFAIRKGPLQAFASNFWFGVLCFACVFIASFIVAKVSYEHFERHFLALKRYFEPQTSAVPALSERQTLPGTSVS